MAIELPRAYRGAPRRGRGTALPDAGNIQQVQSQSVGAPRIPNVSRSDGTDQLVRAAATWARGIEQEAERQAKQFDAVSTTEAQLAFENDGMAEFRRLQVEDDPSRPDFITSYSEFLKKRSDDAISKLPDKVRPEAKDNLRLKLLASAQGMSDSAGRLSLVAGENKAKSVIDGMINKYSAQAARDPDFLDTLLTTANDDLGAFRGTMRPEAERAAIEKARQSIIKSSISGLVKTDRYADAEALIASGKFDEDIDATTLTAINADINRGKNAAKAEIRALANDHFASLSVTGVGISGLGDKAAKLLDGQDLSDFRKRENTARLAFKAGQDFKFASPQEMERGLSAMAPKPGSTNFADEQRVYESLVNRAQQIVRARHNDPAGYALQDPRVADAYERAKSEPDWLPIAVTRSLAVQEQMGVPSTVRRVLPDGAAKGQVAELTQMDPERAADTMLSLRNQYGKYWPRVFSEMVAEKLPGEMQVLGTLDAPGDAVARRDLAAALKTGRKTLADNLAPEMKTEVDKALQGALDGWARLELSRGATDANVQSIRSSAEMLAYSYVARGKSPADAANAAAKSLVLDRYDILDSRGFSLYVPKGLGSRVETTAGNVLDRLKAEDLADIGGAPSLTPEQRKGEYLKAARRGRWVLNETGDGAVLLDPLNQPVMQQAGGRVQFMFDALEDRPAMQPVGLPTP